MIDLQNMKIEAKRLTQLRKRVEESLQGAPKGSIRSQMARGKYPQYYLCDKSNRKIGPNGRYLRKEEQDLAKKLVQKEYDLSVLEILCKQEKAVKQFIHSYPDVRITKLLEVFPEAKKRIITPYVPTDEEFLAKWMQEGELERNSYPITNGFVTEKGETVRSKSEKMIADKLYYMKIPYKYEAVLRLKNNRILFPDFTLLNLRTRKTFYLEHFGMMDDPEYCKKALEKIETYEMNHLFLNETLLMTMESSMKGINMQQINHLIRRFLV